MERLDRMQCLDRMVSIETASHINDCDEDDCEEDDCDKYDCDDDDFNELDVFEEKLDEDFENDSNNTMDIEDNQKQGQSSAESMVDIHQESETRDDEGAEPVNLNPDDTCTVASDVSVRDYTKLPRELNDNFAKYDVR